MYGEPVDDAAELDVSAGHKMKWFSEGDEWSGGAWLTAGDSAAVILIGTQAVGDSWYGFANGVVYPTSGEEGQQVPEVPPFPYDQRGWWSKQIEAQMIFYDPADLAAVVHGKLKPWEPQPYAKLALDPFLFDPGFDHERQKRYLVGDVAFDRAAACCTSWSGVPTARRTWSTCFKSLLNMVQMMGSEATHGVGWHMNARGIDMQKYLAVGAAISLLGWCVAAHAETLYVAPDGNDAWSGRLARPNAGRTDGPLASLQGARDAIRSQKAAAPWPNRCRY